MSIKYDVIKQISKLKIMCLKCWYIDVYLMFYYGVAVNNPLKSVLMLDQMKWDNQG
ncbi:hypothetical protein DCPSUM001_12000 [Dysgonomonas capnocytophagoides]|nr:hypothetical protein DCPSUM001_12000 [Dysgonomonas capnocytophagoides]